MSSTWTGRRSIAALFAVLLAAGALVLAPQRADAVGDTQTSRLEGANRYETAKAIALDTFPDGADTVVLATGETFVDSLAANGLAGALDAPLVLTTSASLHAAADSAITTLDPTRIVIMGGVKAVSQAIEDELKADGYTVERIQGSTRWQTAAAAADRIAITPDGIGSTSGGKTAFLVNGLKFPDAVSASPGAYFAGIPILLTETDSVPASTLQALEDHGISLIIVIGGSAVVSDGVFSAIQNEGYSVRRIWGTNRYATNIAVNRYTDNQFDFTGPAVFLATGQAPWDAMAGGPAAGTSGSPLVLTPTASLGPDANEYLSSLASVFDIIKTLGGSKAVSDATLATAAAATKQTDSNETYDVNPAQDDPQARAPGYDRDDLTAASPPTTGGEYCDDEDAPIVLPPADPVDCGVGEVVLSATGLNPGSTYNIALVDPAVVTFGATDISFSSFTLASAATLSIEKVRQSEDDLAGGEEDGQDDHESGSDATSERKAAEGVANSLGQVWFRVDSLEISSAFPVIYLDTDGDNVLDLESGLPNEPFGMGGKLSWVPLEAADGTYDDIEVAEVDRVNDHFVDTANRTFEFGLDDTFAGGPTDPDEFDAMLTPGDILDVDYVSAGESTFTVVTDDVPPASGVSASADELTVTISWTPSTQPDAVYEIWLDDGDGVFEAGNGDDTLLEDEATGSSFEIEYGSDEIGERSYWLRTVGSATGTKTPALETNTVSVSLPVAILGNGLTVSSDAANDDKATLGDVWYLHLNQSPLTIANDASITISDGVNQLVLDLDDAGTPNVTVDGNVLVVTVDTLVLFDVTYPATVTDLSGVNDSSGAPAGDTELENDGPELMLDTSTCTVGASSCEIQFNEPVDVDPASFRRATRTANYDTTAGDFVVVDTGDARTFTFTFGKVGGLAAGDTIGPFVDVSDPPNGTFEQGDFGVADAGGQVSTQQPFDFVT